MNSEVILDTTQPEPPIKLPCLLRIKETGLIVLMSEPNIGVVVHSGTSCVAIGTYSKWSFDRNPSDWQRVPNNEKVVLQNT